MNGEWSWPEAFAFVGFVLAIAWMVQSFTRARYGFRIKFKDPDDKAE